MTRVEWKTHGARTWESGVDRGILFPASSPGVAWNGLISVDIHNTDSVEPIYFDGTKINDLVTLGDFSATLRAYTYPDEFHPFDGVKEDEDGLYVTGQPHERFGLSYRTLISDETGKPIGYKLHIVWNVTAMISQKTYRTMGMEAEPLELEWSLSAIPEDVSFFRPTAHIIIDSRTIDDWLLTDIETILYGDETRDPYLPPLSAILAFMRKWERLIIVDNADGTWTAIARNDEDITMLTEDSFEITADNVVYLDATTYEISSSDKNEEDIY